MTTETPESVRHAARLHQLPGQPRLERTQDFFLYGVAEDRLNQQSVDMGPRLRQRRPQASALHSQRMLQEVRQNNWRSECRARLLYISSRMCRDGRWDRVQHECIRCLKAISNNKVGLKKLFEHREALTLLARSFDPSLPTVMVEAVKLMAGICLVPPEGHEKALEAITISGELKGNPRFQPIIEALANMDNDTLTVRI